MCLSDGLLLDRSDVVLVVIDVQEKLLPHIYEADRVADNIGRLVRFSEIVGIPIVVAEQNKLGPTVGVLREAVGGAEPLVKVAFGALADPGFAARLLALGRKTLVLTGIEAHICVTQTALQALPSFRVHVVADAVGSRDPVNREVALSRMRRAGAIVTSTEMVIYEVLREAGTDEFRKTLPLVK